MSLKVIHIDRKKIDREAEAREFREKILLPKWEKQSQARAERIMTELRNGKRSTSEFTTQKEVISQNSDQNGHQKD